MDRPRPSRRQTHRGGNLCRQESNVLKQASREADFDDFASATTNPNLALHPTNTKDDLVRKWLAETVEETDAQRNRHSTSKHKRGKFCFNMSRESTYTPRLALEHHEIRQSPDIDFLAHREAAYEEERRHSKSGRKQRKRNSSSDSSLLEGGVPPKSETQIRDEAAAKYRKQGKSSSKLQRKQKVETPDIQTAGQSRNRQETFEKRPRHKTREDLYEPKDRQKNSRSYDEEKQPKSGREKRGDKTRATRKVGEDLIHNFSSENIAQDRLTVSIWCSGGERERDIYIYIYMLNSSSFDPPNVLASSTTAEHPHHKGIEAVCSCSQYESNTLTASTVPDLASSKMSFLQQPIRVPATKNHDKAKSKSRNKDRRRVEGEQGEISTFFKAQRASVQVAEANSCRARSSTYMSEEQRKSKKRKLDDHYVDDYTNLQCTGFLESPDLRSGQLARLSGTVWKPRECSHSRQPPSQGSSPTGKWSRSETTSVTWSDTDQSQMATAASRRLRNESDIPASPIPDAIRRSIERTGIFRDTGIESMIALDGPRMTRSSDERTVLHELPSEFSNRCCSLIANQSISESYERRQKSLGESQSPRISISEWENTKQGSSRGAHGGHNYDKGHRQKSPVRSNQGVVVHSAPNLGRRSGSLTAPAIPIAEALCSKVPQQSTSPSLTRKQLARKARIRHQHTLSRAKPVEEQKPRDLRESHAISLSNHDCQQQTGQRELCNTLASPEGIAAPNVALSNSKTEHECRVEGTMDEIQQSRCHENHFIIRPNSAVHVTPPETEYSGPVILDQGCIVTDNSAAIHQASQTQASNTAANSFTTWSGGMVSQPSCLLPMSEYPQQDFIQFSQLYPREEHQIPYEEDYGYGRHGNRLEDDKNAVIPYVGHTEHGLG